MATNGRSDLPKVVAEITSLGDKYGFAKVERVIINGQPLQQQPQSGEGIFILPKLAQMLVGGKDSWSVGSTIVLALFENPKVEMRGTTPWASIHAYLEHDLNRKGFAPTSEELAVQAARTAERVAEKVKVAIAAWTEIDSAQEDKEARPAAEDLIAATAAADRQAAKSALGRLEARTAELKIAILRRQEFARVGEELKELLVPLPVAPTS